MKARARGEATGASARRRRGDAPTVGWVDGESLEALCERMREIGARAAARRLPRDDVEDCAQGFVAHMLERFDAEERPAPADRPGMTMPDITLLRFVRLISCAATLLAVAALVPRAGPSAAAASQRPRHASRALRSFSSAQRSRPRHPGRTRASARRRATGAVAALRASYGPYVLPNGRVMFGRAADRRTATGAEERTAGAIRRSRARQ